MAQTLDALAAQTEGRRRLRDSALLLVILGVIVAALVWAYLAVVDDVTRAMGRVVPAGDVQRITASENSTIVNLFVSEGDIVAAGQALVELDGLVQNSQLDVENQRALALQASIARLSAEIDDAILRMPEAIEHSAPQIAASETALHLARRSAQTAEIAVLQRQLQQRGQDRLRLQGKLSSAQRILALLADQRHIIAPLVASGIEPQLSLLRLQRDEEAQAGDIGMIQAELARVSLEIKETLDAITATRAKFRAEAIEALNRATSELASLRPAIDALSGLAGRATLRAPMRAVVNRLHKRTIGGMVQAGEDILELVPIDHDLLVEAYIPPQDIAFLAVGKPVRVKLTAYDFTRYGTLGGTVLRLGADTVHLGQRDAEEVFVATIRTEGAILDGAGQPVQILPGMRAEVEIQTGRRRVIDYLFQPFEQLQDRAFKE